jgi:hypothetical protein
LGTLLTGCNNAPAEDPNLLPEEPPQVEFLSPTDHLNRASIALRARRASPEEMRAVQQDPGQLEVIIDAYLETDDFGLMIRDMHAESLLMRSERIGLPSVGPLFGTEMGEIYRSLAEAPLRLIEDIVMSNKPYTDIVLADYTMGNAISALVWGLDYDAGGPEWQHLSWPLDPSPTIMSPPGPPETRPAAGILSSSELWLRHYSNGSNYHRGRGNLIADALLCSDFLGRDVPISGTIDLSDDDAVAAAVNTQKECVGCHQSLDPLSGYLWPFRQRIGNFVVSTIYTEENSICDEDPNSFEALINCYPLLDYTKSSSNGWQLRGLRPPGYYGLGADDLGDLGGLIANDPRFSLCAARRFYGYLGQVDVDSVPLDVAAPLQQIFADSGYDAKALARAVVLSDAFRASHLTDAEETEHIAGLQVVRPRHYGRMLEELTDFEWRINPDSATCGLGEIYRCWGEDDLSAGSAFGFTAMAGGIDSQLVTIPTHTMTPVRALFYSALASEAAGYVVPRDAAVSSPEQRELFTTLSSLQASDESSIRSQLEELHLRVLGEFVLTNSIEVNESYALFSVALTNSGGDTQEAWKVVLSALLQSDRAIFY